jgi:hypothetical protein
MNGVVRGFALAIALATSVPCAQVAWAQDPLIFEYHGWRIDLTGARGREADAKMIDTVKRQLDIIERVRLKPQVLQFMRTIKIWANPSGAGGPAHYAGATGVDLRVRALVPTKPIILHELLHAYHGQQLPGGFNNADIESFFQEARTAGWPPGSYMLTNDREFFATTVSVYLFGNIPRPPESRSQIRAKQPRYYQWLAEVFDNGRPRL